MRTQQLGKRGREFESKRQAAIKKRKIAQANTFYKNMPRFSQAQLSARSGETKYFDVGINDTVTWAGADWANSEVPCDNYINSSGTAAAYTDSCLVPTANGSAYGQVEGNKYHLKKLRVRGSLTVSVITGAATLGYPANVRLMLIQDTQANGAQAQGEDVMQDLGAAGENLYSFQRVSANLGKFKILKDEFFDLKVTAGANNASASTVSSTFDPVHFSFQYVPNSPIPMTIKSGNATPSVSGIINNNFFLLLACNIGGTASACAIRGASRCYYID